MKAVIADKAKGRSGIVQNIEYLSERDLKYFEKKEALGEAIIIRIEPEILLSLDLDALFQDQSKDQTLSEEELERFFHGNQPRNSLEVTARTSEAQEGSGIENDLLNIHLSPDKQQSLLQMINDGASDEELKNLLNITTGEAV